MKTLSRKDVFSALVTGCTTGIIAWRILVYLGHGLPGDIAPWLLAVIVPPLWIAGVQLGYWLSALFRPFEQFGRFAAIGFANAAVDFGVLFLFIAATGLAAGLAYAIFKTISFVVSATHSYLWNKYWAFDAGRSRGGVREIASFISTILVALLINVSIASLVVALRPETIAAASWAGVGAIAGSGSALLATFIGFRVFVFKKK